MEHPEVTGPVDGLSDCPGQRLQEPGGTELAIGEDMPRRLFWQPPARRARIGRTPLMAMTFDATLKDMGRDSPRGFLATFDRPPAGPVRLLNVDLSTVTALADLVLGLGEPL